MSTNIAGYSKLTKEQQQLFDRIYAKHQACWGEEARKDWTAKKVRWIAKERYLRVEFGNGEWLHYCLNGTWW